MQPKTFHFILVIIFLISSHSLSFNTGGEDGRSEMISPETSSPHSGGSGAAHGPNWDYNWGWGSSPGAGWGYGSGSGRSPDGFGRGWGFGFGSGSGSGTGFGYGYGTGGGGGSGGENGGSGGYSSDRAPSINPGERYYHG